MKILYLSEYFPFPPDNGSKQRIWHTIQHLSQRHQLFLVTFQSDLIDSTALDEVRRYVDVTLCAPPSLPGWRKLLNFASPTPLGVWRRHSPDFMRTVRRLAAEQDIDAVFLVELWLATYVQPNGRILSVIDKHNLEFVRARRRLETVGPGNGRDQPLRWYYQVIYRRLKRYELQTLRQFSATLVCSDHDAALLHQLDETLRTYVMPNGVDPTYFYPQPGQTQEISLVFTGTFSYEPNVDAAVYFVAEILPLIREEYPEVMLYLVGSNPHPRVKALAADAHVIVTGYVDDVRPFVWGATAVIVPLRMGSGTRLKILEALAMGKALVSTSIGCEGIAVSPGDHLLLADTAADFAQAVCHLLRDEALRAALGKKGRELVERQYTWEKTVTALDELFPH